MEFIPVAKPLMGAEEEQEVIDTLRSGFIGTGPKTAQFEKEFASYIGRKRALGIDSCTNSMHMTFVALGIGPGDEVITTPMTFVATANSIVYTGATPVFVDVQPDTMDIDPVQIEKAITPRTKAILPVHLYGHPCDMEEISAVAKKHKLILLEDACQAHGAVYKSTRAQGARAQEFKAGSIGDAGSFSFYPTKNLGGFGDGGMVVTNDQKLAEKLLLLRDCGRKSKYEHVVLGYNSRLDTFQAAGLRVKLKYLDQWNKMRAYNAKIYDNFLENAQNVIRPVGADYSSHVYHIYAVRVKKRDKVVEQLKAAGVGVLVNYPIPLHLQQAYHGLGYVKGEIPVAENVCREIISLPMHPLLNKTEIKYVVKVLKKAAED